VDIEDTYCEVDTAELGEIASEKLVLLGNRNALQMLSSDLKSSSSFGI